jgi:hypothetical protein
MPSTKVAIRVADEVWIAAALLQREHPSKKDFSVGEILARVEEEGIFGELRPGVYVHIIQHCVANRPPNPGRYRMLFETGKTRRRLFWHGDSYNPAREDSKTTPAREDIPAKYQLLLDWYDAEYIRRKPNAQTDPLLSLRGSGKKIWAGEHADEYVRRLREGWE